MNRLRTIFSWSLCSANFLRRLVIPSVILILVILYVFHITDHQHPVDPAISLFYNVPDRPVEPIADNIPHLVQPRSSPITRGILVFYSSSQEQSFLPELLWLYRSWIEMMKSEISLWRTDLIIYTDNYTVHLFNLGCVFNRIRVDRDELPQCRVFPYRRISDRDLSVVNLTGLSEYQKIDMKRSRLITRYLRSYEYVDSINIINEYYTSYAMYDFILRTDLDVFLTKNFGVFVPANDTFLVGRGGYSTPFNMARLKRVAKNLNWSYADLSNIGSTWYGSPQMARTTANLTLYAMAYLSWNEFTTPERERKLGVMLWPEWHYGVLLLYGAHLAINHLVYSDHFHLGLAYDLLDQDVTSKDPTDIEKNRRLHLHCWHGDEPFSKFAFKDGKYNHLPANAFASDTSASGYAMRMALESRQMSTTDLRGLLQIVTRISKSSTT